MAVCLQLEETAEPSDLREGRGHAPPEGGWHTVVWLNPAWSTSLVTARKLQEISVGQGQTTVGKREHSPLGGRNTWLCSRLVPLGLHAPLAHHLFGLCLNWVALRSQT